MPTIPALQNGFTSDLQVLQSAAGYYLGTTFTHGPSSPYAGMVEPNSRESYHYYPTREAAQEALDQGTWVQRLNY